MKSKIIILLGAVLCMVACNDSSAVRDAKGAYRYKTTGQVTVEESVEQDGWTKIDSTVVNLDNESGTLEVVSLHNGDSLLLTLDQKNGDVTVTRGAINDGRLHFVPYHRTLDVPTVVKYYDTITLDLGLITRDTILVRERNEYEVYDITVSGSAEVYDNNLVFNLNYNGKSQTTERTLRGRDIRSLAKKN